ncbi:IS481 family transposase [Salinibacterium sp. ZJ450]|uniref:IS481 family transposase n=1 Tax=Salinibacterium sp. ZJ450 TaxID=2708338 RepID=UPI001747F9E5|nr:IS481 family transposase [Salinibacterium sp. ZJ450]
MTKNRIIVTSVVLEGRSKADVARDYGVSSRWVHTLVRRYLEGGWDAIEPRSRRPKRSPTKTKPEIEAEILRLRRELTAQGHDAGPHTIHFHLSTRFDTVPSVATIWRILDRHDLITPQPRKRPRSSYTRFQAELPNETWQSDFTHWHLADSTGVEILTFLDDHSRLALSVTANRVTTGQIVVADFRRNVEEYGPPASTLTDNGLVFTTRVRGGKNAFENDLRLLGITQKNGRPNHPQTQGKVERFQQTMKNWLAKQPPASTLTELQHHLDQFRDYYNTQRPHRSLDRKTPAQAYAALGKAGPSGTVDGHWRIREDRVDATGSITLRYNSKLHHIGIGRAHKHTRVKVLVHDRHIRVIATTTGQLLRELILDPTRDYQPQKQQNPHSGE